MPPPGKPYTPSGAAGAFAREAAEVDTDYAFFLRNVRLDGSAYALYLPSKDGVSPPEVIRYEDPLADCNVGAPVAGSAGGGQRGPPPSEEHSRAARNSTRAAPYGAASPRAGVKRKAPYVSPPAKARSGAVPVEEDPPAPATEPAWYDSQPGIDEDYRFFLRHAHTVDEDTVVFKVGNLTIPMGREPSVHNSDAEEEDEDESIRTIPASGQSGEDAVGTEEEEEQEKVKSGKGAKPDSDLQIVNVIDLEVKEEELSEEEEGEEEEEEESPEEEEDEEDEDWKVEGEVDSEVGPGTDLQIVNALEFEIEEEVEEEGELIVPVKGITESQQLNREANSSKGNPAIARNALELQGVIWPPHITERPNSDFKEKLTRILLKPFKQEEYDRYFAMANNRTPVVKERRTRHNVVYYPWKHEMGKSYFDNYPDLAEQFELQVNNYPNRLALLRGFFFWLENVGREDQFRPWRDDFKGYRVVSMT